MGTQPESHEPLLPLAVTPAEERIPPELLDEISEAFDNFWRVYPRKVGKGAARRAWLKMAVPRAQADQRAMREHLAKVMAAARRYAAGPLPQAKFIPHPTTWLREERWDDAPPRTRRYRTTCPNCRHEFPFGDSDLLAEPEAGGR